MKKKLLVTTLILSAASITLINANAATNFYVGGSAGYSALNTPTGSAFTVTNTDPGETVYETGSKNDAGGFGSGLFAGYTINPFWAVELGYTNYAETSYESSQSGYDNASPTDISTNTATLSYNTYSVDLFFKGTLPLQEKLSAFAKVGVSYVNQAVDYTNPSSGDPTISINGDTFATPKMGKNTYTAYRPAGGLGFTYAINDRFSASLFGQGFIGSGDFETDQDAIASAYLVGASVIVNI
jgi:hypothetical protein